MTDRTDSGTEREAPLPDVEAVDRLIRLTEIASEPAHPPAERTKLQDELHVWAASSPENLRSFLKMAAIFEALGTCEAEMVQEFVAHIVSTMDLESLTPVKNGLAVVKSSARTSCSRRRVARSWSKLALAAAAVVAAVATSIFLWPAAAGTTYRTLAGEQLRVPLEDGSVVYLNERSEIRVSFSNIRRGVSLVHGEVLFDVTHDARRPFVVLSNTAEIQALGTRFDVYEHSGATRVAVVDGSISVMTTPASNLPLPFLSSTRRGVAGQPLTLTKYEVAEVNGQEVARQANADVEHIVAWQSAELLVNHEPLAEIAAEFNRHNRRQLRITDPAAAHRRISGRYKTDHPEGLVGVLQQLYPDLTVQETDDGWVVNTAGR